LAKFPGVEITGTVADVRPYYSRALAAVVPLLSGSGTRLKILEAMAAGVPVISTTVGAEGLDAVPGEHLLLAEARDPAAWVTHVSRLSESASERQRVSAAALDFVRARYDWNMLERKIEAVYTGWLRNGS
jgi:glycosyltransferase involved in cell wall biosynthesis